MILNPIEWTSNDVTYRALKLKETCDLNSIVKCIDTLVGQSLIPTKIIATSKWMHAIRDFWSDKIGTGMSGEALLSLSRHNLPGIILQIDRRISDAVYILFEEMDKADVEAKEFDGLDTLP